MGALYDPNLGPNGPKTIFFLRESFRPIISRSRPKFRSIFGLYRYPVKQLNALSLKYIEEEVQAL